jgi:hypothetical protein
MEISRRKFIKLMLGTFVIAFSGLAGFLKFFMPAGVVYASKADAYPGRIKNFRKSDILKPARWIG